MGPFATKYGDNIKLPIRKKQQRLAKILRLSPTR